MFHQGAAGRRAGGSGLGLGLYLVRRLTQVLGGRVRLVEADPGRTVFEVTLPVRPETPSGA
jgi:signal transduction histidine kinase